MTTPDPLIVVIDQTPHRYLSPNSGKHERTRRPHKDALKDAAAVGAMNALNGRTWAWDGPIVVHMEIFWPKGHKSLDWDNAIASAKSALDGVFAKLEANDRQVVAITMPKQERDKLGSGYMVLILEPKEQAA